MKHLNTQNVLFSPPSWRLNDTLLQIFAHEWHKPIDEALSALSERTQCVFVCTAAACERIFYCTCVCVCPCAMCAAACGDRKWRAGVSSLSMLPTYPLFNPAVSMVMNEGIATWMIGANPGVIGLIMDTHSEK